MPVGKGPSPSKRVITFLRVLGVGVIVPLGKGQ